MSINVSAKTNYSYLLSSLSSGSSSSSLGNLNFLSDYASIKNGSYYKLMKAYYTKNSSDSSSSSSMTSKSSISTASDTTKALSEVESAADFMKESADALLTKGTSSVFNKKSVTKTDENGLSTTTKEYDTDAIYSKVSQFVTDYNTLMKKTAASSSSTLQNKADNLAGVSSSNASLLSRVGITINEDKTLSLDEKTFKSADMGTAKTLFGTTGGYGYQVSAQASLIDFAAETESSKANTYTSTGTYSNAYSTGNILNSFL